MKENTQEDIKVIKDGDPATPFEGKLDISHIVSVIMDHIGGVVRIPAEKFTSSITVDRKLVIEYDSNSQDFILSVEQGLVGSGPEVE